MAPNFSDQLLALCRVDSKIVNIQNQKSELEIGRAAYMAELRERRHRLAELEDAHKQGTLQQVLEQHKVRDEHEKIVNRRKQLTGMGGAKVAKLLEREIEIASRTVEAMEQRALKAVEHVDVLDAQLSDLRGSLEKLEAQFEADAPSFEKTIQDFEAKLKTFNDEREQVSITLEERLLRLYNRVRTRYPAEAVALAEDGSCRSCFRSLPAQTYNQILAGNNLIQCPGCSRILIVAPKE